MNSDELKGSLKVEYQVSKAQQEQKQTFQVNRTLNDETALIGSYLTDLPTIDGLNAIDLLDAAQKAKRNFCILDVGCGQGNFLATLSEIYGNQFIYDGISTYPYHDEKHMASLGVNIEIADIQHTFRANTYDLIVAEHSLQYTLNPLIALKRIYSALKPGGIALLYPLTVHFTSQEEERSFIEYLSSNYDFNFIEGKKDWQGGWKVAFRKREKKLSFPASINTIKAVGNEYINLNQAEYNFNKLKT